jgi:hypothetical protein
MRIYSALRQKALEKDKQQHFLYSFLIFVVLSSIFTPATSCALTLLIGLAKEVWDHYFGSGFCWYDMSANFVGIIFALLVSQLWIS